jgi:tRNA U34 5-methylaminomethyl-2-thiouridine-forming methyltransferase MnmC
MKKKEMKVIGEFESDFCQYKIIETEDGSKTLYSGYYQEACHSLAGAVNETIHNYILGCEVPSRIKNYKTFNILEVGFGLGIGVITTIDYLLDNNLNHPIHFISLEIDQALIEWSRENLSLKHKDFKIFDSLKLIKTNDLTYYQGQFKNVTLTILIGDARKTLKTATNQKLIPEIHAIYQDAFSPKQNPRLWTVNWFELLKSISHHDVILSTYSASSSVKKSLVQAKWIIEKRVGFGTKKAATRAKVHGELDEDIKLYLSRSPINPVYDSDIK